MPRVYPITQRPESRENALQAVLSASDSDEVTFTRKVLMGDKERLGGALALVRKLPVGWIVRIAKRNRTKEQSDKMWAMLTDLSRAQPVWTEGPYKGQPIQRTPEQWKFLAMNQCDYDCQFMIGLNGKPFATGFRSSQLTIGQMSNLIEWIYAYGAEHNVQWSEPMPEFENAA